MNRFSLILGVFFVFGACNSQTVAEMPSGEFDCRLTGYYSPQLGQKSYLNGDYAGAIRMNGQGTNGASGAPVGIGMIAAPPSFPFGTQVEIPGWGTMQVEDRGGRIQSLADGSHKIDIWTGAGHKGLKKALELGETRTKCRIVPENERVEINFPVIITREKILTQNYQKNDQSEEIKKVQRLLQHKGFLKATPNGYFGAQTEDALFAYQLFYGLADKESHRDAKKIQNMTWIYVNADLEDFYYQHQQQNSSEEAPAFTYDQNFALGDQHDDIYRLQSFLNAQKYLEASPTGYFGTKTEAALTHFQLNSRIITQKNHGGRFGPQTRAFLNKNHVYKEKTTDFSTKKETFPQKTTKNTEYTPAPLLNFEKTSLRGESLQKGDEGPRVALLQQELRRLGHFSGPTVPSFGPKTEKALIQYQIDQKIVQSEIEKGTGVFGPQTQAALLAE